MSDKAFNRMIWAVTLTGFALIFAALAIWQSLGGNPSDFTMPPR